MRREVTIPVLAMALVLAHLVGQPAHAAGDEPVARPEVVDLGEGRYRIGTIELDKPAGSFTVPGHVLRVEPPLEFLAVAREGHKGYESLLELDATAFEFNLACILIGLDAERASRPKYHFDPEQLDGDRVAIEVSWMREGKPVRKSAVALLREAGKPVTTDEWIYTGSHFTSNGQFLAEQDGTLIGLVHDPSSVIEHRIGMGLGRYGDLRGAPGAPDVGTQVVLTVRRAAEPRAAETPDSSPATP